MTKTLKRMALSGAVLLSSLAVAQPEGRTQQRGQPGRTGSQAGMQGGTQMEEITFDERGLLERLHDIHQREIAWGKLAQSNASMQSTRDYAETMVRDHESADQRVVQVAEMRKVKLGKPDLTSREKRMKSLHDATEQFLKEAQGPTFDSVYLSTQVMAHDKAIQMLTAAQSRFPGAELASVVGQVIPRLQSHREQAYRALGEVGQPRGMGGAGMGSDTGGSGKSRDPGSESGMGGGMQRRDGGM
jgi:putative membrane protein